MSRDSSSFVLLFYIIHGPKRSRSSWPAIPSSRPAVSILFSLSSFDIFLFLFSVPDDCCWIGNLLYCSFYGHRAALDGCNGVVVVGIRGRTGKTSFHWRQIEIKKKGRELDRRRRHRRMQIPPYSFRRVAGPTVKHCRYSFQFNQFPSLRIFVCSIILFSSLSNLKEWGAPPDCVFFEPLYVSMDPVVCVSARRPAGIEILRLLRWPCE